jgi:multiple sugar transport system substrate-binding protein
MLPRLLFRMRNRQSLLDRLGRDSDNARGLRARSSARALALLVLLGATSGCREPENDVVLEFWAAGREGEIVARLTRDFEAEHPGIRVEVQQLPWTGAHEKLLTAVVGETTPDIAQLGNTWIPEFATIGALHPLDAAVASSGTIQPIDYFEGAWETNRFDGRLYGVPWYVDTRLLFYRRDLLAGAGFDEPPQSWREWLAMLEAIQKQAGSERTALFLPLNEFEPLVALGLQQKEPLLRDGDRFGNFRSAGFRRALAFYVDLFGRGFAPKAGSAQIANVWDEFARGTFVFYISGPWQIGEFKRRLPAALSGSWMTAPLPGPDGPGSSIAGGSSLVVFAASKRKPEAWRFIEYLARPAVQRRFYELTGDLPPRRSSWQDSALATDVHAKAFWNQLERVEPTPKVPEWERIATQLAIVGERAARELSSVDDAAAELDDRTDRILEKRRWILARGESE